MENLEKKLSEVGPRWVSQSKHFRLQLSPWLLSAWPGVGDNAVTRLLLFCAMTMNHLNHEATTFIMMG